MISAGDQCPVMQSYSAKMLHPQTLSSIICLWGNTTGHQNRGGVSRVAITSAIRHSSQTPAWSVCHCDREHSLSLSGVNSSTIKRPADVKMEKKTYLAESERSSHLSLFGHETFGTRLDCLFDIHDNLLNLLSSRAQGGCHVITNSIG